MKGLTHFYVNGPHHVPEQAVKELMTLLPDLECTVRPVNYVEAPDPRKVGEETECQ
jgi:hypothetical protein